MKILAIVLLLASAVAGWAWQSHPYRLSGPGMPADQSALAHRDSAYSSSSWIGSQAENFLQLRFFDRVEGGVCLRPTWAEISEMAAQDPRLAHLVPIGSPPAPEPAEKTWDFATLPDPGTLPNTKYVTMFPAGILLNEPLVQAAGGDTRASAPRICVVGLGSGVGIAVLAHHFPKAIIAVVDIDRTVIEMVRDHYPLLRWLEEQGRLQLVVRDARQFIRSESRLGTRWDMIILDAYTSGSTIPPHLMTREFYSECALALGDSGVLLSNIIGSYEPSKTGGSKHLVLGGAIRSMIAAGLPHVHNMPMVVVDPRSGEFDLAAQKNNIVLASKRPLGPRTAAASWERMKMFVPYPEFRTFAQGEKRFTSTTIGLTDDKVFITSAVDFGLLEAIEPGLRAKLPLTRSELVQRFASADRGVIEQTAAAVRQAYAGKRMPLGWADVREAKSVLMSQVDWVDHARKVWATTIQQARDASQHGGTALVGDSDAARPQSRIPKAPLFTDARPNADIYNGG